MYSAVMLFFLVVAIFLVVPIEGYALSNASECASTKANPALISRFNMFFFSYEHISAHLSPMQSAMSIVYAFCGIVFAFTFLIALIVVLRHVKLYWDPLKAAELLRSQNALLESIKVERPNPNQKTPLVGGGVASNTEVASNTAA